MDAKYVCPCGLTCCDCLFHKREIYETARKLQALLADHKLDRFLALCSAPRSWAAMSEHLDLPAEKRADAAGNPFAVFAQLPAFMAVLDALGKLECKATCREAGGCSIGGARHECRALKCLRGRGYEGCWQCGETDGCANLRFLRTSYGHVIDENLRTVREHGPAALEPRGDKYYAWQRRGE